MPEKNQEKGRDGRLEIPENSWNFRIPEIPAKSSSQNSQREQQLQQGKGSTGERVKVFGSGEFFQARFSLWNCWGGGVGAALPSWIIPDFSIGICGNAESSLGGGGIPSEFQVFTGSRGMRRRKTHPQYFPWECPSGPAFLGSFPLCFFPYHQTVGKLGKAAIQTLNIQFRPFGKHQKFPKKPLNSLDPP